MAGLAGKPSAKADAVPAPGGRPPPAVMYTVMGKMFAIVGLGEVEHVILKRDPRLVEVLKRPTPASATVPASTPELDQRRIGRRRSQLLAVNSG